MAATASAADVGRHPASGPLQPELPADRHTRRHRTWTAEYVVSGEVSEDCLFLNVWTPARQRAQAAGAGLDPWGRFHKRIGLRTDYGTGLGAKGIIVVTINYRVGVYGFLAHPH